MNLGEQRISKEDHLPLEWGKLLDNIAYYIAISSLMWNVS